MKINCICSFNCYLFSNYLQDIGNSEVSEANASSAEEDVESDNDDQIAHGEDHRIHPLHPVMQEGEDGGLNLPPLGNNDGVGMADLGDVLCGCTATTEGDAFLMCLALGIRHGLSWVAIVDILKMINKLFGRDVIRASKYFFMKHFDVSKGCTTVHMYCPSCDGYLGTKETVVDGQIVECNNCQTDVQPFSKNSSYFVSVDMKRQLRNIMEQPHVAHEVMTYRFERRKIQENALEDIYDGRMYKQLSEPGQPLSNPLNLSFTINTDGVATGKASKQSAWPLFLHINEVAPVNRKKHMLYAGMWVGKQQPNMTLFLRDFVADLRSLFTEGFTWTDGQGILQTSRVFPILAVLDSGARFKFVNLSAHSCYYGCTFCYQRALNTVKGRRFNAMIDAAPLRTHESMIEDMEIAYTRRHNIRRHRYHRGCKGYTPLVRLSPYLNLGRAVVVDYMHNCLSGVTRAHVMHMLTTVNITFYIGSPEKKFTMNERLKKFKPPTSITRTPRDLDDVKLYKASEWRSFLIFYGILCFDRVLGEKYREHFAMLSCAYFILLKNSITEEELDLAETYLRQYVFLTEQYFGLTSMTYNIHLLLHEIQAVRDFGPVWGHSTFIFEGENHFLAKMHTSPGRMAIQLTRRYLTFRSYPKLCEKFASSNVPLNFISDITGKKFSVFIRCNETVLVGNGTNYQLNDEERECFRVNGFVYDDVPVLSFHKMIYNKIRFTTSDYSMGKNNDDSWIKAQAERRGSIKRILFVDNLKVVVLVQLVQIDRTLILSTPLVKVKHIKRIDQMGPLIAIEPNQIIGQCIHVQHTNNFIADIPFGCYGD